MSDVLDVCQYGVTISLIDDKLGATAALITAYEKSGVDLKDIGYKAARWYEYFETDPIELMRLFGAPGSFS